MKKEINQSTDNNVILQKLDPLGVIQAYSEIYDSWMSHPEQVAPDILEFLKLAAEVNQQVFLRSVGEPTKGSVVPHAEDEQFKDPIWQENPWSDLIKEYYLLTLYWALQKINKTKDVDVAIKKRANFWTQQLFNAFSPTNFFFLNPRAIMNFLETGGKSLEDGLKNLAEDLIHHDVSMVDASGFKVGENLATTPGKVIFRNELIE
jgi:polyhydroxyalkanoate synthase subunit PhaC